MDNNDLMEDRSVLLESSGIETLADPSSPTVSTSDHFVREHGEEFAGKHYLIDFWGAHSLDDQPYLEHALTRAAKEAGAVLLHLNMHVFDEGGGITGVALLAESHISVHTWPERSYAAFDVFMCGDARPERAVAYLKSAFKPKTVDIREIKRGCSSHYGVSPL